MPYTDDLAWCERHSKGEMGSGFSIPLVNFPPGMPHWRSDAAAQDRGAFAKALATLPKAELVGVAWGWIIQRSSKEVVFDTAHVRFVS